jgi:hypothetical protein
MPVIDIVFLSVASGERASIYPEACMQLLNRFSRLSIACPRLTVGGHHLTDRPVFPYPNESMTGTSDQSLQNPVAALPYSLPVLSALQPLLQSLLVELPPLKLIFRKALPMRRSSLATC